MAQLKRLDSLSFSVALGKVQTRSEKPGRLLHSRLGGLSLQRHRATQYTHGAINDSQVLDSVSLATVSGIELVSRLEIIAR